MKLLKAGCKFLGLIALMLCAGLAALMWWLRPEKLQPILIQQIKERSGYELLTKDQMQLRWLPPSLQISAMQIRDPKQPQTQMDFKQVAMHLDLSALIQDRNNLQGKITIQQLKVNRWQFDNIKIFPHWYENQLDLSPVQAELYDGQLAGKIHARDLKSTIPIWSGSGQISQLNVGKWQQGVAPNKKFSLQGLADLDVQLRTRGKAEAQFIANLNGVLHLSMKQGAMMGIDINYWLRVAENILLHQPAPNHESQTNRTSFSNLIGDIDIKNGIAYTKNLQMTSEHFVANVQGEFDLQKQTLDLRLVVKPLVSSHTDWIVPIIISGDLKQPAISLDLLEIDKFIAKKQIEKVKDRVKEEIGKRLPEKAGNFLQKLIGN